MKRVTGRLLFYGWVIAFTGLIVEALGYGVRYSFSVIFPSLLEEFAWSRDATAAMLSVHILMYGITAPVSGALVDRLGPRKTMATGATLLALGAGLSSLGNQLWHYYLSFGVLTGMGLCLVGSVPFTRLLANWFVERRGAALSILFFGTGGAFLFSPLIAFLISTVTWRGTFAVMAAMIAGVVLPLVVLLVRHHPSEMGLLPDGSKEKQTSSRREKEKTELIVDRKWTAIDWTLPQAMRTYRFWALCMTAFTLWGLGMHILVAHHVAFAVDAGYSELYASSMLGLFGVMMMIGTLVGFLSDRMGREFIVTVATVLAISGIVALTLMRDTSHPWMFYSYAIFFGLGNGIATPTIAASAIDLFQGRRAGATIGFIWFSFSIGGALGPWLAGYIFEVSQSYTPAFLLGAAMFAVGCAAVWVAAPRKVRVGTGRARAAK